MIGDDSETAGICRRFVIAPRGVAYIKTPNYPNLQR